MWQFVFTNLFMISLGTILYLVARSLPRISGEDESRKPNLLERWIMSDIPHKMDRTVNAYAGKLFRRLRIYVMRMDNFLTERLKKMNGNGNGVLVSQAKPKIDLKDVSGDGSEAEEKKTSLL